MSIRPSGFLIGDQLSHPFGHLNRTAFQLDDRDGDAVQVEHDAGPPLVAALEGHLLGQGEVVPLGMSPVDQVDGFMGLASAGLHLDPIAQQLVGFQIGLIEGDAGGVGGGFELVEGSGDVGGGVAALGEVCAQEFRLDGPVTLPLAPLAQVSIGSPASPAGPGR